ncbi:MAG: ribosomal-protein-alanine N-acetyltransferase [Thermoprotei archaeon]|nr:MAG: ribosomal-protein-alanine N-acetyltransferase [Thermoprotei archaeon]RLF20282.1 MAG: ribosomal-protein-alanine N-acetyltransferase [Thermoprotei archaeon]
MSENTGKSKDVVLLHAPIGLVKIRRFRPEDLDEVIKINRENLPENYPPAFFMEHYYRFPKAFLVAELNNQLVGYIMCRVERGFSNFGFGIVKKGHIISLAVRPFARRNKIGYTLLKTAMKALKEDYGVDEYYLEVRVSNIPAISLYEKLGYVKVRRIIGYYLDGEDAWLMACKAK